MVSIWEPEWISTSCHGQAGAAPLSSCYRGPARVSIYSDTISGSKVISSRGKWVTTGTDAPHNLNVMCAFCNAPSDVLACCLCCNHGTGSAAAQHCASGIWEVYTVLSMEQDLRLTAEATFR